MFHAKICYACEQLQQAQSQSQAFSFTSALSQQQANFNPHQWNALRCSSCLCAIARVRKRIRRSQPKRFFRRKGQLDLKKLSSRPYVEGKLSGGDEDNKCFRTACCHAGWLPVTCYGANKRSCYGSRYILIDARPSSYFPKYHHLRDVLG